MLDKSLNIEAVKPELVTSVQVGQNNSLGAIVLFPKSETRSAKRYWIDFDDIYEKYKDMAIFKQFIDIEKKIFVGNCKVGIKQGEVFLAPIDNPSNQLNPNQDAFKKLFAKYGNSLFVKDLREKLDASPPWLGEWVYNESINIEAEVPVLVTTPRESANIKELGAVLFFPKEGKRHWISFDDIYARYKDTDIIKYFIDIKKKMFIGQCKVGVNKGEVFLAPIDNSSDQNEDYNENYNDRDYSEEKYGGYNGYDDDTIDEAFEGDPEYTWNVD